MRSERTEVLVVGAGPAGLAAAHAAAQAGRAVMLIDDNPDLGGQVWRRDVTGRHADVTRSTEHRGRELERSGVQVHRSTTIVHADGPTRLWAHRDGQLLHIHTDRIVLATGARERTLPFPGWTLPGVFGAGGLQALVKAGLDVQSQRVVVAGTGPLLLAVARGLRLAGAQVVRVLEQTSAVRFARFGAGLWRWPAKLRQGLGLMVDGGRIPLRLGCWPRAAHGDGALRGVETIDTRGRSTTIDCDLLACGFGLVPETRLARLLGCEASPTVVVDALQRTTVPGVFAAGEPCGIGGEDKALVEGRIAGLVAADREAQAQALTRQRDRWRAFATSLAEAFALRDELRALPHDDTIVCRCEDVPWALARRHHDTRSAKLLGRCGMGPCQGRVCEPALSFLLGHGPGRPRPPLFPLPLGVLSELRSTPRDESP